MTAARPLVLALLLASSARSAEPPIEITADTTLDPSRTYGAIVVKASGVTIDGRGASVVGSTDGDPRLFRGVGISARGVSNVTLKDVRAKGWETGLRVEDGEGWTVRGCDFSDNFHDPDFGWGEQGRRGGIVLERVRKSTLAGNKANRVWDACVLVDSDENAITGNDFSRTSNTGLKLWHSSRNEARSNDLSYGLRIGPGEVHARDSAGLLVESGSNDNRFVANDCTHGGDGVFVRVLNGWVSAGNLFEGNDASFANNNGFEAWSPRNTYVGNKANGCSYGFWLGASDQTVLIGNEASHNGDPGGFHNSPHLPGDGHAGIVFLFGPSSHTVARGNTCKNNNGAGIALVGDEASKGERYKAFHWVIEDNTLTGNRWGLYARHADWIDLAGNHLEGNREAGFSRDETVTNVSERAITDRDPGTPAVKLDGPAVARVGDSVVLDASSSLAPSGRPLAFRWDLGDGTVSDDARVAHAFGAPGFYRLGVTANDGQRAGLAWRDLYVVDDAPEVAADASAWEGVDSRSAARFSEDRSARLAGDSSVRADVDPYDGGRAWLAFEPKGAPLSLEGKSSLHFWIKAENPNLTGWQGPNPVVTILGTDGGKLTLTPRVDRLAQPPYTEAREGWTLFEVPLRGGGGWKRAGEVPPRAKTIAVGLDSWGGDGFRVWIDGVSIH